MPHVTIPVNAQSGPVLRLFVGVSAIRHEALKTAGSPVPAPIALDFLVDTGASTTLVDAKIIEPLGLTPSGFILCHTPSTAGTPVQLPQYDMGLFLNHEDHTKFFQNLAITASDFSQQNIHGLLGRDVLEH